MGIAVAAFIGFGAALTSSMSGAGSALFATPLLLACGYGIHGGLAFNQFSAAAWTPVAARNYLQNGRIEWQAILAVTILGLIGVVIGHRIVVEIPTEQLKPLIGALILIVVLFVYFKDKLRREAVERRGSIWMMYLLAIPLGAYQAIFGSGNTIFLSLLFSRIFGLDLARSLGHSYAVSFLWCTVSAVLFYYQGWFDWQLTVPATCGSLLGAYVGSQAGNRLGAGFVRQMFLFLGAVLGLKLAFGF